MLYEFLAKTKTPKEASVVQITSHSAVGSRPATALKKAMGRYADGLALDLRGLDRVFR